MDGFASRSPQGPKYQHAQCLGKQLMTSTRHDRIPTSAQLPRGDSGQTDGGS
jgi:hypothetical protein